MQLSLHDFIINHLFSPFDFFSLDNQEQFHVSIWDLLLYKPTAAHMLLCQTKEEHFTQPLRNSN